MNDSNPIMLSICCITYNHALYIKECIDGFLMQKTNFSFEILIHDDASTDGTIEILEEYKERYPDIIHLFLEKENQYSLKKNGKKIICDAVTWLLPYAKGKYVALCEGDDYWTDPYKLQKQVDFLEENPDFSGCCTKARIYDEDTKSFLSYLYPNPYGYSLDEEKQGYIVTSEASVLKRYIGSTLSSVFRKEAILKNFDVIKEMTYFYDFSWYYFAAKEGKLITFDWVSGVYRMHKGGIWNSINMLNRRKILIRVYSELNRIYPSCTLKILIGRLIYKIIRYDSPRILGEKIRNFLNKRDSKR